MGRTILITGCSSGIGRACALGLKERGWKVFATARKEADLRELKALGLTPIHLDYADPESVQLCADEVLMLTGGRLDALFNNGAYGQPGAVEDLTREVLRAQFEANLFGWHDLTRRLIPAMRVNGGGRIVQNSSVLGFVAMKWRGAYNASKFALEGLSDTLRLELKPFGIHVSIIEPGPIATRFMENALKAFEANIDAEKSPYRDIYAAQRARLQSGRGSAAMARFRLPPEAVLKKLMHALESPRPKPRYYVTVPTHAMAIARRLLPFRLIDRILDGAD